jgi:hypothetical protein
VRFCTLVNALNAFLGKLSPSETASGTVKPPERLYPKATTANPPFPVPPGVPCGLEQAEALLRIVPDPPSPSEPIFAFKEYKWSQKARLKMLAATQKIMKEHGGTTITQEAVDAFYEARDMLAASLCNCSRWSADVAIRLLGDTVKAYEIVRSFIPGEDADTLVLRVPLSSGIKEIEARALLIWSPPTENRHPVLPPEASPEKGISYQLRNAEERVIKRLEESVETADNLPDCFYYTWPPLPDAPRLSNSNRHAPRLSYRATPHNRGISSLKNFEERARRYAEDAGRPFTPEEAKGAFADVQERIEQKQARNQATYIKRKEKLRAKAKAAKERNQRLEEVRKKAQELIYGKLPACLRNKDTLSPNETP